MKKGLRGVAALLVCLMLLAVCPLQAFAAGPIDTARSASLTISYTDESKAVPKARFAIYRVADVDEYAALTLTSAFEPYKGTVSGLADLASLTKEQWLDLASTLRAYVLRDDLTPIAEGRTDAAGQLSFSGLKPGLYLVTGSRVTTDDNYTYTSVPFLVLLPTEDLENNEWNYDVTVVPKHTKDYNPPEDDDKYVTRKVLKVWDDDGYETIRPQEVVVQLLRDGEVFDTQTLNEENNWRYAWDELDRHCEWDVVEKNLENYTVTVTRSGITFTVTNKYGLPAVDAELPIYKRLVGDTPPTPIPFTFIFSAGDESFPMPAGSLGTRKELMTLGAGSQQVGVIKFDEPGTYVYTVREINDGVEGYIYDSTVYIVTFEVTEKDGEMSVKRTIRTDTGVEADAVIFTNSYTKPENKVPNTGMLWWPVPVLLFAGLAFLTLGVIRRRKYN